MRFEFIDFASVMLLGGLIGSGELISRYRDAPTRVLRTSPALFYIVLNAVASCAGLLLIRTYGWKFALSPAATGSPPDATHAERLTEVLVAGLAAMALFRSALFTVRIAGQDVGIGPVAFLQVVLAAADRGVDRRNATARIAIITDTMAGVSFDRAKELLPSLCFSLMMNVSKDDQADFARQVVAIGQGDMDDGARASLLGLSLLNLVGDEVLTDAVKSLGAKIRPLPAPADPVVAPAHV